MKNLKETMAQGLSETGAPSGFAQTLKETKQPYTIRLSPDLMRRVKIRAAQDNIPNHSDVIAAALEIYLTKHKNI